MTAKYQYFPTDIDNVFGFFSAAAEDPVSDGGKWTGPIASGGSLNKIVSPGNLQGSSFGGSPFQSYYQLATFTNVEIYQIVPTIQSAGAHIAIWWGVTDPGTGTAAGYQLRYDENDKTFRVYALTAGTVMTQISSTYTYTMTDFDYYGVRVFNGRVEIYLITNSVDHLPHLIGTAYCGKVTGYIGFENWININTVLSTFVAHEYNGEKKHQYTPQKRYPTITKGGAS